MFLYSKVVVAAAAATLRGWLDRAAEADLRLSNQPSKAALRSISYRSDH